MCIFVKDILSPFTLHLFVVDVVDSEITNSEEFFGSNPFLEQNGSKGTELQVATCNNGRVMMQQRRTPGFFSYMFCGGMDKMRDFFPHWNSTNILEASPEKKLLKLRCYVMFSESMNLVFWALIQKRRTQGYIPRSSMTFCECAPRHKWPKR